MSHRRESCFTWNTAGTGTVHSGGTCAGRAGMFAACGMAVNVLHTRAPNLQTNARNLSFQSLSTGYH
jgi:hypothetical protein